LDPFPDEKEVEFAIKLHGHLSPGIALGMRMAKIAYRKLGTERRGKGITGIAETHRCIPDALQVIAGTTPGTKNLIIKDFGKLALSIILYEEKVGYRVSLRKDAAEINDGLKKFMYKLGKLEEEEERKLSEFLLTLNERYFNIQKIKVSMLKEEKAEIAECSICQELQPRNYMVEEDEELVCFICKGDRYFESLD
jgi:formylmethanofuran dehydrogenase subunit E